MSRYAITELAHLNIARLSSAEPSTKGVSQLAEETVRDVIRHGAVTACQVDGQVGCAEGHVIEGQEACVVPVDGCLLRGVMPVMVLRGRQDSPQEGKAHPHTRAYTTSNSGMANKPGA